jgi:hypothetical protein
LACAQREEAVVAPSILLSAHPCCTPIPPLLLRHSLPNRGAFMAVAAYMCTMLFLRIKMPSYLMWNQYYD